MPFATLKADARSLHSQMTRGAKDPPPRAAEGAASHPPLRPVANGTRVGNIALGRKLLAVTQQRSPTLRGTHARPGRHHQCRAGDSRTPATLSELSVLRQQNAHRRGLPARPDAQAQSLTAPPIHPDLYVMTMVVETQQYDVASACPPAGVADPWARRGR